MAMPDRLRRPYLLLRRVMALLCTTALLGLPAFVLAFVVRRRFEKETPPS